MHPVQRHHRYNQGALYSAMSRVLHACYLRPSKRGRQGASLKRGEKGRLLPTGTMILATSRRQKYYSIDHNNTACELAQSLQGNSRQAKEEWRKRKYSNPSYIKI